MFTIHYILTGEIHDIFATEEVTEISGSEEFSSFPEDLVAEQLTYMDAVSINRCILFVSINTDYDSEVFVLFIP